MTHDQSKGRALAQTFVDEYETADEKGDYSTVSFYTGAADMFEPDEVSANVVARVRVSTNNGWMSDGSLTWVLAEFADGSTVTLRADDNLGGEVKVEELPTEPVARAGAVASWCDIYGPLAVLELEPLDPDGTLTSDARDAWASAIAAANSSVELSSDEPFCDLLRAAFGTDEVYRRAKAALALPDSEEGRLLFAAIDYLQVSPEVFCLGTWEDAAE